MKLYTIKVRSHSGYKAEERPVQFILEGREYTISEILYQSRELSLEGDIKNRFIVKTNEELVFNILYDVIQDRWFLEK